MRRNRHSRLASAVKRGLIAGLAMMLISFPRPAAAELEVVFLDADANLANIARLRSKMTNYLKTIDPDARFKAFAKHADLERYLATNPVHFVIVSDAVATRLDRKLRPIATPLRNGSTTYHKVMVVRRGTDAEDIKVVATTSSPSEVLAIELPGRASDTPLRVLQVSKGFDALLGMTFNRADAAYVTPETVSALEEVDPKLAANLRELYRSPPLPNPRLHAVTGNVSSAIERKVTRAFIEMDKSKTGREVLKVLDYTGWSDK